MATNKNSAKYSLTNSLYDKVNKSLKSKEIQKTYKTNLDTYLASNMDKYFGRGPAHRPILTEEQSSQFISLLGLTPAQINQAVKESKDINPSWFMANPYVMANAVATRSCLREKNKALTELTVGYLIIRLYPPIHWKYVKYDINEACMEYTINNLNSKFNLKKSENFWMLLMNTAYGAVDLHESKLIEGSDVAYIKYVQDVQSRLNSLMKNIFSRYYDNYSEQKFIKTEHEIYDDDNYYEADSNSYAIDRITYKVVNYLILNGPDSKLIQLAANTSKISVNELRNYLDRIIVPKHTDDIKSMVESILFLYLFNDEDGEAHSPGTITTNEFMIYCLQIYRKSNTTNKNIIKIKSIMDKW